MLNLVQVRLLTLNLVELKRELRELIIDLYQKEEILTPDEAKRLAAIEKSGSFDQGFSDYSTAYSRASMDQYELYNRMKMTNDFSNYSIDEELIKNMRGKTKDEKIAILDQ